MDIPRLLIDIAVMALALYPSIFLHECGHYLAARLLRVPVTAFGLQSPHDGGSWSFRGHVRVVVDGHSAATVRLIAIAGPLASLLVAAVCWYAHIWSIAAVNGILAGVALAGSDGRQFVHPFPKEVS